MTGYYSNLALHISEATLKGHRRLSVEQRMHWGHVAWGMAGAAAVCAEACAAIMPLKQAARMPSRGVFKSTPCE